MTPMGSGLTLTEKPGSSGCESASSNLRPDACHSLGLRVSAAITTTSGQSTDQGVATEASSRRGLVQRVTPQPIVCSARRWPATLCHHNDSLSIGRKLQKPLARRTSCGRGLDPLARLTTQPLDPGTGWRRCRTDCAVTASSSSCRSRRSLDGGMRGRAIFPGELLRWSWLRLQ